MFSIVSRSTSSSKALSRSEGSIATTIRGLRKKSSIGEDIDRTVTAKNNLTVNFTDKAIEIIRNGSNAKPILTGLVGGTESGLNIRPTSLSNTLASIKNHKFHFDFILSRNKVLITAKLRVRIY